MLLISRNSLMVYSQLPSQRRRGVGLTTTSVKLLYHIWEFGNILIFLVRFLETQTWIFCGWSRTTQLWSFQCWMELVGLQVWKSPWSRSKQPWQGWLKANWDHLLQPLNVWWAPTIRDCMCCCWAVIPHLASARNGEMGSCSVWFNGEARGVGVKWGMNYDQLRAWGGENLTHVMGFCNCNLLFLAAEWEMPHTHGKLSGGVAFTSSSSTRSLGPASSCSSLPWRPKLGILCPCFPQSCSAAS